jgi:cytosolic carboxypeptidase protein 2/3
MGRQHPGESVGSHVLKGSIDQLLTGSDLTMKILQSCDFVIIPMMNPDGVVAGNFRTSLFGKDINRLWKAKDSTLIP